MPEGQGEVGERWVKVKFIMVRREVLDELKASPEWSKKFEEAKTLDERQQVLSDFCRAKGFEVVEVAAAA